MATTARIALITGSTTGMGLEMARKFAKEGHEVILNGFATEEETNKIKAELKLLNGKDALYVGADLTQMDQVEMLVKEVLKAYPAGIDVLINNAGVFIIGNSQQTTVEDLDLELSLMVKAPFLLCKRFIPYMKERAKGNDHGGRIINMSSIAGMGTMHSGDCGVYVSAKHAIIGLTKSLAVEVAKDNITCNALCPGATETPMWNNTKMSLAKLGTISTNEVEALWKDNQPVGIVESDKVAELAWFLCSSGAKYITGSPILIDGGYML